MTGDTSRPPFSRLLKDTRIGELAADRQTLPGSSALRPRLFSLQDISLHFKSPSWQNLSATITQPTSPACGQRWPTVTGKDIRFLLDTWAEPSPPAWPRTYRRPQGEAAQADGHKLTHAWVNYQICLQAQLWGDVWLKCSRSIWHNCWLIVVCLLGIPFHFSECGGPLQSYWLQGLWSCSCLQILVWNQQVLHEDAAFNEAPICSRELSFQSGFEGTLNHDLMLQDWAWPVTIWRRLHATVQVLKDSNTQKKSAFPGCKQWLSVNLASCHIRRPTLLAVYILQPHRW